MKVGNIRSNGERAGRKLRGKEGKRRVELVEKRERGIEEE